MGRRQNTSIPPIDSRGCGGNVAPRKRPGQHRLSFPHVDNIARLLGCADGFEFKRGISDHALDAEKLTHVLENSVAKSGELGSTSRNFLRVWRYS